MDAQGPAHPEYDSSKNLVKLFDNARVKRGQDIVIGSTTVYNTRTKPCRQWWHRPGAATNKMPGG